jgi:hypothetical protein
VPAGFTAQNVRYCIYQSVMMRRQDATRPRDVCRPR